MGDDVMTAAIAESPQLHVPGTPERPLAVLSLLHQPRHGHSGELRLWGRSVLMHTLERLAEAGMGGTQRVVLAWDDQAGVAGDVAASCGATLFAAGPRRRLPAMEAVTRALRWSDGWRTTLGRCCAFDAGFDAATLQSVLSRYPAAWLVLVDPASPLLPPEVVRELLRHAALHPDRDWFYLPTPPGATAVLLRATWLNELQRLQRHPGAMLHYHPDRYGADPVSTPHCAPAPVALCRSLLQFRIDRPDLAQAAEHGFPDGPPGSVETLLSRWNVVSTLPADVRVELTTARRTRPVFVPPLEKGPEELPLQAVCALLDQLAAPQPAAHAPPPPSPTRLTLGHLGDPLLHPRWREVLREAAARSIPVCLETDLVGLDDGTRADLLAQPWDVLVVHLPAASRPTYAAVMGLDAFDDVMSALEAVVKGADGRLVVPLFTLVADNLAEREPWYDHFVRVLGRPGSSGGGVLVSASTWAGRLGELGGPDLTPPGRAPCRRLRTRLTVRACGAASACENDLQGELLAGERPASLPTGAGPSAGVADVRAVWQGPMGDLRRQHESGGILPMLCQRCRDFFRP